MTGAEHRTVARVMSILELVIASDERGMRLSDLAASLEAPKSSLHALTKGLLSNGYLREEDSRYYVGPAVSSLISAAPAPNVRVYRRILAELASMWDETAMLATFVGDSVVYLDCVEAENFIRAIPVLNKRLTLWPRSSGQVFLSNADPRRLEGYLRRNHPDPQAAAAVRAELEATRERGYGLNIDGSVAGHLGLAVPVPIAGAVTAAVAVAGPRPRMEDRVEEIVKSMHDAVATLGRSN